MINTLLLIALTGVLIWFLRRRKLPREVFFGAVFFSIVIFFISYWMIKALFDSYSPGLEDGVVPFLISVAPVAGFLKWFLNDAKKTMRK